MAEETATQGPSAAPVAGFQFAPEPALDASAASHAVDAAPAEVAPQPVQDNRPEHVPMERLNRESKKRKEAEARARDAEIRLARLEGRLEATAKPADAAQPATVEKEPALEDFEDFSSFSKAQARYEAKQEYVAVQRAERERMEAESRRLTAEQAQNKYYSNLNTKMADGVSKFADYDEVVRDNSVPFTEPILKILVNSDKFAEMSYYLAQNKDKLHAINQMMVNNPSGAAFEIGRLEAAISRPAAPRTTQTPAPVIPLNPNGAAGEKEFNVADFIRERNKSMVRR